MNERDRLSVEVNSLLGRAMKRARMRNLEMAERLGVPRSTITQATRLGAYNRGNMTLWRLADLFEATGFRLEMKIKPIRRKR